LLGTAASGTGVHDVVPTLLERGFNIPPLADLARETERIAHPGAAPTT